MYEQNARVVRGINIAIIVLAVLSLVSNVMLMAGLGGLGAVASDPSLASSMQASISADAETAAKMQQLGMDSSDALGLVSGLMIFGSATMFIFVAISAIQLVGGIMGLRAGKGKSQLGGAFVWAIVAAVLSALAFSIVTLVLFIISAVKLNGMKKLATQSPLQK